MHDLSLCLLSPLYETLVTQPHHEGYTVKDYQEGSYSSSHQLTKPKRDIYWKGQSHPRLYQLYEMGGPYALM